MALRLPSLTETFKVVLRSPIESAVTCTDEQYGQYLETLDESLLGLQSEPTRIVMRKVLPAAAQAEITNSQFTLEDGEMKFRLGSAAKSEIQAAIVGIENPEGIPEDQKLVFKKASNGLCHDDIISLLGAAGVLMDLWRARQQAVGSQGKNQELFKKK